MRSAISGMRSWSIFHSTVLRGSGDALPPTLDGLLQWSLAFRHPKTFSNYMSYLALACAVEGVSADVFRHPNIKRAKEAIRKRMLFQRKPKTFIRLPLLQEMIAMLIEKPVLKELLMLFLASYIFLLRVPSEGLPMAAHRSAAGFTVPVFTCHGDHVRIQFPRRKNSYEATELIRYCWCERCPITCPVHVLGAFMDTVAPGVQPFAHIKYSQLRLALHELLAELGVEDALDYGTHSFRRGHCDDLEKNGSTAAEICAMGRLCV